MLARLFKPRFGAVMAPALTTLIGAAALLATGGAAAQTATGGLTVEALIGDSVSNAGSDRYADVAEAIQRFQNRDQLSARTFLERAVQKDSKLPPVGVLIAKLQLLSGNSAAVRPALEQAVQEDSGADPEPFLLLAEEALSSGRTIEADALFDKAAALIESYTANSKRKRQFIIRASRGRAIVADRRENWQLAESALRQWLEQDPNDASALSRLGQVLFMLDRPRDGYESFVAAKKENGDLPSPYVSAALMYDRQGDTDNAMTAFKRAYQENADDETTLVAYAQALVRAGDLSTAGSVLKRARSAAPGSANVWLLSGVVGRMEGDAATAKKHLQQAHALAPANRDILNQLAQTLIDSSDETEKARALQYSSMNAQLNANNPDVNITHAWVLFQNGQGARAAAAVRQGLQGGALSSDGSYLLAKMLVERNDRANAKRVLESALKNEQGIFVQKTQAEALMGTL